MNLTAMISAGAGATLLAGVLAFAVASSVASAEKTRAHASDSQFERGRSLGRAEQALAARAAQEKERARFEKARADDEKRMAGERAALEAQAASARARAQAAITAIKRKEPAYAQCDDLDFPAALRGFGAEGLGPREVPAPREGVLRKPAPAPADRDDGAFVGLRDGPSPAAIAAGLGADARRGAPAGERL